MAEISYLDTDDLKDGGAVDVSIPLYVLDHVFLGGPAPAIPGPLFCGVNLTQEDLSCDSDHASDL